MGEHSKHIKAAAKRYKSGIIAASKRHQSDIKATSKRHQSDMKTTTENAKNNFRHIHGGTLKTPWGNLLQGVGGTGSPEQPSTIS